jgi:F-box-like
MALPQPACDPLSDPREEEIRLIKFRAVDRGISMALEGTVTAIRGVTEEVTASLEEHLSSIKQQGTDSLNVVSIRHCREAEYLQACIPGEKFTEGPIQALPAEMLGEIFYHYVELNNSPWELGKVCRRWMETALGTPQLWRRIQFTNEKQITFGESWIFDGHRKFCVGNVQICNSAMELDKALSRSGATPLEISIRLRNNWQQYTHIPSVMASLLNDPTSRRITSLEIYSAAIAGPSLVPGPFPLLKNIGWYGPALPWTNQLFAMISATSSHLEKVRFPGILTPQLVDLPFWSRIKAVASDRSSLAQQLNKVAHKLTNLEGHFRGPNAWPNLHTPVVTWPNIRSLSLRCCPGELQHLQVPYLESLEIEEPQINSRPYVELIFPNLTTLKLTTCDARWLSAVSLPRLTTLEVISPCTQSAEDNSFVFRCLSFPMVQTLTLGSRWNDTAVIAALEAVPNLLILNVAGTIRPYSCRTEVLKRLSGGQLCPRLESLFLGNEAWPVYTLMTTMVPTIKRLIKTRKMMRHPLKKFVVCWGIGPTRSGKESFV